MKSTRSGLASLVVLVALGGCSSGPEEPGKPRVALVMKSLANEFFKTMEEGARAHQAGSQLRAHDAEPEETNLGRRRHSRSGRRRRS